MWNLSWRTKECSHGYQYRYWWGTCSWSSPQGDLLTSPLKQQLMVQRMSSSTYNLAMTWPWQKLKKHLKLFIKAAGQGVNIWLGTSIDETMKDEIRVTVVATGVRQDGVESSPRKRGSFKCPNSSNTFDGPTPVASNVPQAEAPKSSAFGRVGSPSWKHSSHPWCRSAISSICWKIHYRRWWRWIRYSAIL